jgi:DNA polymerase
MISSTEFYKKLQDRQVVFFDFETFSKLDLKKYDSYNYSNDLSTEVLCLCYKFYGKQTKCFFPILKPDIYPAMPKDLTYAINNDYIFIAHNAFFDYMIWNNVLVRKEQWPYLKRDQIFDTQALCCAYSLPAALGPATKVLQLPTKLQEGKSLIEKLSKPKKPTKKDPRDRIFQFDLLMQMVEYCKQDVEILETLFDYLPLLPKQEIDIWRATFETNINGINVDRETAESVLYLVDEYNKRFNTELQKLTNRFVETGGQTAKIKEYIFNTWGYEIESLNKDFIAKELDRTDVEPDYKRLLELRLALGKTSTGKFTQLLDKSDSNGVLRNNLMYHGTSTGRWTSHGMQIHNMLRHNFEQDLQQIADIINKKDTFTFSLFFPKQPIKTLAAFIRPCIWSCKTNSIYCGDYSQIEARMAFHLSGESKGLKEFKRGEDLYKNLASLIFNVKVEDITKEGEERYIGKQGVLSSIYGVGGQKTNNRLCQETKIDTKELGKRILKNKLESNTLDVSTFCRGFFNDFICMADHKKQYVEFMKAYQSHGLEVLDRIKKDFGIVAGNIIVKTFRDKYPKIPIWWRNLERAAIEAITSERPITTNYVTFAYDKKLKFLFVYLPSGRRQAYFRPYLKSEINKFGKETVQFRYYGIEQKTKQFVKLEMYGGKWAENIDSGICRDIMANAKLSLLKKGYRILFSAHDEIVSSKQNGSLEEFNKEMLRKPKWLPKEFPLEVESWNGDRYHK